MKNLMKQTLQQKSVNDAHEPFGEGLTASLYGSPSAIGTSGKLRSSEFA